MSNDIFMLWLITMSDVQRRCWYDDHSGESLGLHDMVILA